MTSLSSAIRKEPIDGTYITLSSVREVDQGRNGI